MLRKLAVLAVLALVLVAAFAAAATLDVGGGAIQFGEDTDLTCDDAVQVAGWGLETDDGLVYFVRIGNIAMPECSGNAMFVQVLGEGDVILADGKFDPLGSNTVKVDIDPAVPAEDIVALKVWIEGGNP